ncbi:helix-turn-helix domain-containing protein [Streptomyces sp. NPDC091217]|uniref:AlbA family DNA-binding domain-containing protein n=1 Tax=Streptomyces sp. NPDC091217 TaxID=3365975 RepID=UPI00382EEA77
MTAVDGRVRIVTLLAQQRPEAVLGMTESEWVDFKSTGLEGPYDLGQESKKYELAKDVAAFANTNGGLIVCGFKATRRPTDLHETVVKPTPFAKRLVNAEKYKKVIAEYVRPLVSVEFSWFDDPTHQDLGYLVIEVQALPESDRWALVTRTLSEEGRLVKGGVSIPRRHGDQTEYVTPDEVYRLINNGFHAEPTLDLDLSVEDGIAISVTVDDSVIDSLMEKRRRELLASLPPSERRSGGQREGKSLFSNGQRAVEELRRLQEVTQVSLPDLLTRDLRSPQQYREEVEAYLEKNRGALLRMLNKAVAEEGKPLNLRLDNRSNAMLHQVEVIATVDPGYLVTVEPPEFTAALGNLPWPEPPEPYGKKTPAAGLKSSPIFPSWTFYADRRQSLAGPLPKCFTSEDGLAIKFPPVDLRAHAHTWLQPFMLCGHPSTAGAALLRWTATCTNRDGRQEKVLSIPVDELSVTLRPDGETPELVTK